MTHPTNHSSDGAASGVPDATGTPPVAPPRPAFAPLPVGIEDDGTPAVLCVALAGSFLLLGLLRHSALAFTIAGLFAVLVLILMLMNTTARRVG